MATYSKRGYKAPKEKEVKDDAIENVTIDVMDTGAGSQFDSEKQAVMPADCTMQVQAAGDTGTLGCHSCNTCQLCMAVVTGYPMTPVGAVSLPQAKPAIGSISFSSAERAPGFKPPIS